MNLPKLQTTRNIQMRWLLGLTALSLVPVYVLIGWQTGGHSSQDVVSIFWIIEAGAWGLRALVEAWALIYLFQTVTDSDRASKILIAFEVALIGLIALTVGLVIIANGNKQALATGLPPILYWVWSFSVACFAPLMMGSVGYAFKVHINTIPTHTYIDAINNRIDTLHNLIESKPSPVIDRRNQVRSMIESGKTQKVMAAELGVSIGTIQSDIKALNGVVK